MRPTNAGLRRSFTDAAGEKMTQPLDRQQTSAWALSTDGGANCLYQAQGIPPLHYKSSECSTLSSTASRTVSCCFKVSPMASPMPFSVPIPFSMLSKALSCLAFASSQSCSRVEVLHMTHYVYPESHHHKHSAHLPAAFICLPNAPP